MKALVIVSLFCLLLPRMVTGAQIYRCEDPSGVPRFQSFACPGGGGEVELGPPAARWEALRPAERQLWEDSRKARPPRRSSAGAGSDRRASDRSCWQKRQRLDAVSAKLRRGYRPTQGERLRRRRDELRGFIARYCE